jgi:hypothetical protein
MAKASRMERLGGLDLQVLLWDDFGWAGDIGVLASLDGACLLDDGAVRIEAVCRRIESRLHLVPRFRQCLYRAEMGAGPGPTSCWMTSRCWTWGCCGPIRGSWRTRGSTRPTRGTARR